MGQSSTIMQVFTPIGARYLSRVKKYTLFLIGDSPRGGGYLPMLYILESSRRANDINAATYRFRGIRGQNL